VWARTFQRISEMRSSPSESSRARKCPPHPPSVESAYVLAGEGDRFMESDPAKHLEARYAYEIRAGLPHSIRNCNQPTKSRHLVCEKNGRSPLPLRSERSISLWTSPDRQRRLPRPREGSREHAIGRYGASSSSCNGAGKMEAACARRGQGRRVAMGCTHRLWSGALACAGSAALQFFTLFGDLGVGGAISLRMCA
jgi:hypothetical protein